MQLGGHKTSWSSQKDCRQNAPTPPCPALYLTLRIRGYAAWERIKKCLIQQVTLRSGGKALVVQLEWTMLRRSVKPHRSTRGADGWVGFPFWFRKCDLGHDGGLRASVGKRSPKYSTRSPFFLAAMGSTCKQGKPNGNQKREGTTLTLGRRQSKKRRLALLKAIDSEGCFPSS